jgi:hypothetical protein
VSDEQIVQLIDALAHAERRLCALEARLQEMENRAAPSEEGATRPRWPVTEQRQLKDTA